MLRVIVLVDGGQRYGLNPMYKILKIGDKVRFTSNALKSLKGNPCFLQPGPFTVIKIRNSFAYTSNICLLRDADGNCTGIEWSSFWLEKV